MKQKLLNLFTWRATLLVALLCTSFGNAWGDDYEIKNKTDLFEVPITVSSSSSSYSKTIPLTAYFKQITVKAQTANGNTSGTINVYVGDNSEPIASGSVSNKESTISYGYNSDGVFGKNIRIEITRIGNKNLTVNSITVTYTPAAIIEIKSACKCQYDNLYYGTFSNASPFVCPTAVDDFTVSKVSVSNGGVLDVVSLSGTVPANTGVLVSSETAGEKIVKLNNPADSYTAPSNNMLQPSSVAMSGDGYYFYHLTFDNNNPLGFYWGAENGAAWTFSGSNKAYLKVPTGDSGYSAVKGFTLNDSANGIKAIETETEKNSEMVFNLAGQRVSKMQKGIYVVNGKKILVK